MKKKNGLADSPFFAPSPPPLKVPSKKEVVSLSKKPPAKKRKAKFNKYPRIVVTRRPDDTVTPTKQPRHQATTTPSNRDTMTPWLDAEHIAFIRKTVKEVGKEAATHRFTVAEKRTIKKIIFDYERDSLLTSENQITRIAVNIILADYQKNGMKSVLHQVLKALNE